MDGDKKSHVSGGCTADDSRSVEIKGLLFWSSDLGLAVTLTKWMAGEVKSPVNISIFANDDAVPMEIMEEPSNGLLSNCPRGQI